MAGDDNGFAALDLAEQLGQMGLGIGGLDFAHGKHLSTGRSDWSIWHESQ
jgi:hypothetical protein